MAKKIPNQDRIAIEMYEAATRVESKQRTYLGMSQIGKGCSRALWYDFRGFTPAPIDGRFIMLFRFGDRIEEEVIHWLTLAGYKIDGQQAEFSAHNGFFRGHCDGIIYGVTQKPHILEVKSANKKKFEAFKKAGVRKTYPVYYSQCQCYMGYENLERALVVVQCKDNSELYTERLYFNQSDFKALDKRAYQIITSNDPPDKISNKRDCFTCQYCNHIINCWYPEEAIVSERVCGNCYYFGFQGLKPMCKHPDHPYIIKRWGTGCPDWIFLWEKNKKYINRPQRVA